jgi:dTDP-L-rhamnose 4-epimerase
MLYIYLSEVVTKKILITGGAGFIGSHLVDALLAKGHEIIVFDNLEPQVHGNQVNPPEYLAKNITFIKGDIRNHDDLHNAIKDCEVVYHLAARVGVTQSMYQIADFVDVNSRGTAILLDLLVNTEHRVKKLVVASTMSTYGEGAYQCQDCGSIEPNVRMQAPKPGEDWELHCPICGKIALPIPTPETKKQECTTIYALSKKETEELSLMVGKTYGLDTTALRFFGTYGTRQALSNPYTGVCAIFSTSLLAGNSPMLYEDGLQSRDLIYVKDICQALMLSMEKPEAKNEVFNVGTGVPITIKQVAEVLAKNINPAIAPNITYQFRAGDVRHTTADITKISSKLGYKPKYTFETGIKELLEWIKTQPKISFASDKAQQAKEELAKKGLI